MIDKEEDEENDFIDSIGIKATYYNDFVERYFTKYYLNKGTDTEQYIFIHSNGIIMCGIGMNHFATKNNIKSIVDLKKLGKITGRKKHGAHFLCEDEYVVQIFYDNDQKLSFSPKVKGKLLEINDNIITHPNLLSESPEKYGFICLIQIELKSVELLRDKLVQLNKNS